MVEKPNGFISEPHQETVDDAPTKAGITKEEVQILVNTAIGARLRPITEKIDNQFGELRTMLSQQVAHKTEETPVKASKKEDPMVEALLNKVKILEEKDKKARDLNLRMRVQEELIAHKANPQLLKPLMAQFEVEKTVSYASDQSDEIVFKSGESVFTLKDGISTYLSSEEAKPFLAPKGAVGSGDRPYTKQSSKPQQAGKLSMEQAGEALAAILSGSTGE